MGRASWRAGRLGEPARDGGASFGRRRLDPSRASLALALRRGHAGCGSNIGLGVSPVRALLSSGPSGARCAGRRLGRSPAVSGLRLSLRRYVPGALSGFVPGGFPLISSVLVGGLECLAHSGLGEWRVSLGPSVRYPRRGASVGGGALGRLLYSTPLPQCTKALPPLASLAWDWAASWQSLGPLAYRHHDLRAALGFQRWTSAVWFSWLLGIRRGSWRVMVDIYLT